MATTIIGFIGFIRLMTSKNSYSITVFTSSGVSHVYGLQESGSILGCLNILELAIHPNPYPYTR